MNGDKKPRPRGLKSILKEKPALILASVALTLIVLTLVWLTLLKTGKKPKTYGRFLMGTVVEITLMEENPVAVDAAFSEIARLEAIFSSYIPESDVSRISDSAGSGAVSVSPEVIDVLDVALNISGLSRGAFDPTVGVLGKAWDFSKDNGYVPTEAEVKELLALVDYKKILVDKSSSMAGLAKAGMRLNLGGVAKGYIVGKAVGVLKGAGIEWGIVKAGGDMTVFRNDDSAEPFTIGIQHPRKSGELLAKVSVKQGAVATSGDYERFFIKDGVRYHHILDPETGFPATASRSVTIVADDPTGADGLSTAVFVMGADKGMKLVEATEGVEAVIVDSSGNVTVSLGLQENCTIIAPGPTP